MQYCDLKPESEKSFNNMAQIVTKKCEFKGCKVATLYCNNCNLALCINCRQEVHDIFPEYKDHDIVKIQIGGTGVFKQQPVCDSHKSIFRFFCIACDCLICSECVTSTHNQHRTEKIDNFAKRCRHNMKQIIDQLKKKVEKVEMTIATIDKECSKQVQCDYESYVTIVNETTGELHNTIDRNNRIHLTTASDFKVNENENLLRKRIFFKHRHDETVDRFLKFEHVLQEKHDRMFIKEWKDLQTDIQIINEETDDSLEGPSRIETFNRKTFAIAIIEEMDEQFNIG